MAHQPSAIHLLLRIHPSYQHSTQVLIRGRKHREMLPPTLRQHRATTPTIRMKALQEPCNSAPTSCKVPGRLCGLCSTSQSRRIPMHRLHGPDLQVVYRSESQWTPIMQQLLCQSQMEPNINHFHYRRRAFLRSTVTRLP